MVVSKLNRFNTDPHYYGSRIEAMDKGPVSDGIVAEGIRVEETRVAPFAEKCDQSGERYMKFAIPVATAQVVEKPVLVTQ